MIFTETRVPGVLVIDCDVHEDERGTFVPTWVAKEFAERGLETRIVQCNVSTNRRRGTLRGMHFQAAPCEEVKIVRVGRGAIFDVAVDLRPESPTFRQWEGVELDASRPRMIYLPAGVAHGYQTLVDDTEILYTVSAPYSPPHQRGVRWNDPAFGITWPIPAPTSINERDRTYPDFATR